MLMVWSLHSWSAQTRKRRTGRAGTEGGGEGRPEAVQRQVLVDQQHVIVHAARSEHQFMREVSPWLDHPAIIKIAKG